MHAVGCIHQGTQPLGLEKKVVYVKCCGRREIKIKYWQGSQDDACSFTFFPPILWLQRKSGKTVQRLKSLKEEEGQSLKRWKKSCRLRSRAAASQMLGNLGENGGMEQRENSSSSRHSWSSHRSLSLLIFTSAADAPCVIWAPPEAVIPHPLLAPF